LIVSIVKAVRCPMDGDYITVPNCQKCPHFESLVDYFKVKCDYEAEGSIGDAEKASDKEYTARW